MKNNFLISIICWLVGKNRNVYIVIVFHVALSLGVVFCGFVLKIAIFNFALGAFLIPFGMYFPIIYLVMLKNLYSVVTDEENSQLFLSKLTYQHHIVNSKSMVGTWPRFLISTMGHVFIGINCSIACWSVSKILLLISLLLVTIIPIFYFILLRQLLAMVRSTSLVTTLH